MKKIIKKIIRNVFGIELIRIGKSMESKVVSLKPESKIEGNVLMSYVIDPFISDMSESKFNSHTNYWESYQIAKTFLEMGFEVDVINYSNSEFFSPRKNYNIFVGSRINFEKIAQRLNPDCIKIAHLTISHWCYNNKAQCERLLSVQKKKGVTIYPKKIAEINFAIENADFATILGNEFTINTYRYANKNIYRVPISTPVLYPWPEKKDFKSCRKSFLWFGSEGMVHKGLDIVLEAFVAMPDFQLIVCGPISQENDFEKAYYKELYETKNIQTLGWIDITGPKFREITNKCIGLIYPSCAEGGGGSVITCLHASLIPIVSYESSVDIKDDFGFILRNFSLDEIKYAINFVSNLPTEKLETMAREAWKFARQNHTRETFSRDYKKAITSILRERNISFK
jgi:glycosyltransferase involved in cell wall biosynthesis